MGLVEAIIFMALAVAILNMEQTPLCGDCGKRFKHAEDCWRKKGDT